MKGTVKATVAALAFATIAQPALAQVEIQFWHAMGGQLGEATSALVEKFNQSQKEYKVVPVYKGSYTETMTATIAAFRANQHPHIVQVFEVGTATMMAAKGAVYPVHQLMADAGEKFDQAVYVQPVIGYYTSADGKLLSMPFNSSTPVLYWNKELFQKAGLDPEKPPRTWPEVGEMGKKLVTAGVPCGITVQWQTWTMIENFGAWHNIPFATKQNGFAGTDIELKVNDPLRVKHIEALASWQKDNIFKYGGREGRSTALFTAGECAIHIASSGSAGAIQAAFKDRQFGIGMMPYYPDAIAKPQNSIIGGATLWVLQKKGKEEYKGVAKFFTYLSSAETQAAWHQQTGYIPITTAAYELSKQQGFYQKFPGRDVAIQQLMLNPPTENSKGLRIGPFTQIRDITDEELEGVWAGKKTAKQALDDIVSRGNRLLKDFDAAQR
jgi:sn-glycerol 3-phosphate transport system substrate-binding protein